MEETTLQANGSAVHEEKIPFRKGSNPAYNTARSRLQKKRRGLNDDIIKQMRLRSGAENLFRATNNKDVQNRVNMELNFINSKLEVLKTDLAELNSSVKTYQNERSNDAVPMVSLGLKETTDTNFEQVFIDYIEEHYCERGENYLEAIDSLQTLRKAVKTPERSEDGVLLLMNYYNQLWYVEKRFYPPGRSVPVYYTWYDAISGVSTSQKTMGFERGSVLFNVAALYSQLGSAQDRSTSDGLQKAVSYYCKCSSLLKYLRDRFTNAPSLDMHKETLTLLMQLILSQAQECVFEKLVLGYPEKPSFHQLLKISQEAAMVSLMYYEAHVEVAKSPIHNEVPASWITLTRVKNFHYKSLAHLYLAQALISVPKENLPSPQDLEILLKEITDSNNKSQSYTTTHKQQVRYCRDHLNKCLSHSETANRDYTLCKLLRSNDDVFSRVLSDVQHRAEILQLDVWDEDEFADILRQAPDIIPKTDSLVGLEPPDLKQNEVEDFFKALGPISVFSAKREWKIPRTLTLTRDPQAGYGFTLKGEAPCIVAEVSPGRPANLAGVLVGDVVVSINLVDCKWRNQDEIRGLIQEQDDSLTVALVTPMEPAQPNQLTTSESQTLKGSSRSSPSSGIGADMNQSGDTMTSTWRRKMNQLTFLKGKRSRSPNSTVG